MKNRFKKYKKLIIALLLMISYDVYSSPTLMPKTDSGSNPFEANNLLVVIAVILIIPIYLLGKTLLFAVKMSIEKEKKENGNPNGVKILLLLICCLSAQVVFAEDAASTVVAKSQPLLTFTNIVAAVIFVEVLVILVFGSYILTFLKGKKYQVIAQAEVEVEKSSWFAKWWKKTNNFIPFEEEAHLDSGHNYDGIRELDNAIPFWFTSAFVICVLFAVTYLWRYHVSESAPLQIQEYKNELVQAEIEKEEYLKTAANNVDENTIVMLDATGIEAGKTLFAANCVACHGANGASLLGGVGPNLTDNYWLHGGGIKDIFKTIKYGVAEKGMRSWKDQFGATQIAQLASYVKSIGNTNLKGKDPQGDVYKEETIAPARDSDNVKKDTLEIKK